MQHVAALLTIPGLALLTAVSGTDMAKDLITPPLIEGYAERATPVTAGDTELVYWNIIKRTDCPGVAGRVWNGEDGFYMVEPLRKTALPMNVEQQEYRIPTEVPSLAPVGKLDLYIKGYYDCGGDRTEYTLGPVELIVEAK